ncbi:hypothetical protein WA026_007272 [Henosepilachna vigintioctopunctata]|uniref:Uncharacterized protein n=1 Tax=Henosepilachna vigintioctopunctata TaxID=420089 RepID=A0AAW1UPF6_9CUCU
MSVKSYEFLLSILPGLLAVHAPLSRSGQIKQIGYSNNIVGNEDLPQSPCSRKCVTGAPLMLCHYVFTFESYEVLSKACFDCPNNVEDCFRPDCVPADGVKRSILTVNRKMPGPLISVCQGDKVVVDVVNDLSSESASIHWHGQKMRYSPYMDGVPHITQCPIYAKSTFGYNFIAEDAGTHFWHSHIGLQRGDGIFGGLIVRAPREKDLHRNRYDFDLDEHVIIITDWDHSLVTQKYTAHYHNNIKYKSSNILVNGLGRLFGERNNSVPMPTARFKVKKGNRYRFRIINSGFAVCPIEMSIDKHILKVISSDGYDIKETEADSLVTYAGERFDFIIDANQPENVYWIKFKGFMQCKSNNVFQAAVLHYESDTINSNVYPNGDLTYKEMGRSGKQINPLNKGTESSSNTVVAAPDLQSLLPWDETLKEIPDFTYYISYDFFLINNPHFYKPPFYDVNNVKKKRMDSYTPQLNHISMKLLSVPIFSQRDEINEELFCNETTVKYQDCRNNFCSCPHVIQVKLNSVVELILIDNGFAFNSNHPFHLHGHAFRVVAMERVGLNVTLEKVIQMNENGQIRRNLKNPPWKDTVTVPDGGYTVLRFHAANPGYWIFHCHIELHVELGMALVFKVGENKDMLPVPLNFPKCRNYFP